MEREYKARIHLKLDEMMQYIEELRNMLPDEEEYMLDLKSRRACEKTIELAIESVIDVCAMIISSERLGMPSNEENIIDILVEKNILKREFSERLKDMKGFRNILIHRYAHVDDGIVYNNLNDYLDDFIKFKRVIESYMENMK